MATIPVWQTARAGILGDTSAMDNSAQINQTLGAHGLTEIYQGTYITSSSVAASFPGFWGKGGTYWPLNLNINDYDQPFTMVGTSMARITLPVLPVGNGADLKASLCSDSSGAPGTVLAQTRIPAAWITQLAAVAGTANGSASPILGATGNPLATAWTNSVQVGPASTVNWPTPAASGGAGVFTPSVGIGGNYMILVGGVASATPVTGVYTVGWNGTTAFNPAIPQPALPVGTLGSAVAVTSDTLVSAGGAVGSPNVATANVYTASWNPSTGVVGAWSAQASLPAANPSAAGAAYGETVYIIGGSPSVGSTTSLATVSYATVSNNQVTSWSAGPPLPQGLSAPSVGVVGNYLCVTGGFATGSGSNSQAFYYAPINPSTGALGPWQSGTQAPIGVTTDVSQYATTNLGFLVTDGSNFEVVSLTGAGPNPIWHVQLDGVAAGAAIWAAFSSDGVNYQLLTMNPNSNIYYSLPLYTTPWISIPLPATGLTNGSTYHILLQQRGGDLNDYLAMGTDLPGNSGTNAQFRTRGATGAWSTVSAGSVIPLSVYNNAPAGANGALPLHTWEDNGARITTLVYDSTPDQRLIGICEATQFADPINSNTSFETGTTNWNAFNGTVAQSSAHSYIGQFSGLFTPTGGNTTAYIESEQEQVLPGESYTYTFWCYSPAGYGNVILYANWYTTGGTYLSTSFLVTTAVSAATWTQVTASTTAPATSVYGTLLAGETSTPTSSNVIYFDQLSMVSTYGASRLAAVSQLTYNGPWPGTSAWPPTGITRLA